MYIVVRGFLVWFILLFCLRNSSNYLVIPAIVNCLFFFLFTKGVHIYLSFHFQEIIYWSTFTL